MTCYSWGMKLEEARQLVDETRKHLKQCIEYGRRTGMTSYGLTPEATLRLMEAYDALLDVHTGPWVVTRFDENTLYGTIERGSRCINFHSTSFSSDTSQRWPRIGEKVEPVFNADGRLLSLHGS